jgi:hypothetical protein
MLEWGCDTPDWEHLAGLCERTRLALRRARDVLLEVKAERGPYLN